MIEYVHVKTTHKTVHTFAEWLASKLASGYSLKVENNNCIRFYNHQMQAECFREFSSFYPMELPSFIIRSELIGKSKFIEKTP